MTLDARSLKKRYMDRWRASNARERFVMLALNAYLPKPWEARLTGLGAGEDRLIERSYSSVEEAFDITVYYGTTPVAYVDVTGVAGVAEMRGHPCPGKCVGSWKLGKARRHRVVDRAWVAYVVDEDWRVYWLSMRWLDQHEEAPFVNRCRLYSDEREVLCPPHHYWRGFRHFRNWLLNHGLVLARVQGVG